MEIVDMNNLRTKFNQFAWHDSEILSFSVVESDRSYDLVIEFNLFEKANDKTYEKKLKTFRFINCRIIKIDLDLLAMKLCGGQISDAYCYKDSISFEQKIRNKVHTFDLPQERLPLNECLAFNIEMIFPTGEITIFAKTFEVIEI